jgi:hypothetical protein
MAIDGNTATRWQSGVPQGSEDPEWFEIDLGEVTAVDRVVLHSTSLLDQARGVSVTVGNTSRAFNQQPDFSLEPDAMAEALALDLPQQVSGRYVLLQQTGSSTADATNPAWWSINEIDVFSCE